MKPFFLIWLNWALAALTVGIVSGMLPVNLWLKWVLALLWK